MSEETAKAEKPPATELVQSVLMVTPMDDRCLNVLQQKLADRIDALTSHELISVPRAIKRFLAFLDQSPLLGAALDELRNTRPPDWVQGQLDQLRASFPVEGENDLDAAVIGYFALKEFGKHFNIIIQTSRYFGEAKGDDAYLKRFWKLFLEPLSFYLREALPIGA